MNLHIKSLKKACDSLGVQHESVDANGIFLRVIVQHTPHYFIANEVPFNNQIVAKIIADKGHTHDLLSNVIRMPKTLSFLDPNCRELFKPFVVYKTHQEILEKIMNTFTLPIILKKNSGSQGVNVLRCEGESQALKAMEQIFDQSSIEYDHVMLAQEDITVRREFRVTVFQKEIVLVYEKDFSNAQFMGNLSPLHWEGARATIINDDDLKLQIREFIEPIFESLDLQYGGLDVALDKEGKWYLFEINSKPAYNYLVESNGDEVLVNLYKKMLESL